MSLDGEAVERLLAGIPEAVGSLRGEWTALMEQFLWADLASSRLGALTRLRKRWLEHGEALAAMGHSRTWIPHPREQLKSVLGGAIKLRDTLAQVQRAAQTVDGGEDREAVLQTLAAYESRLTSLLQPLENRAAELLDGLHRAGLDDDS